MKLDLDRDCRGEIYVSVNKFFKYDGPSGERLDGVSLYFYYPSDEDFESNLVTGFKQQTTGFGIASLLFPVENPIRVARTGQALAFTGSGLLRQNFFREYKHE